jgi:hypothetical protein
MTIVRFALPEVRPWRLIHGNQVVDVSETLVPDKPTAEDRFAGARQAPEDHQTLHGQRHRADFIAYQPYNPAAVKSRPC